MRIADKTVVDDRKSSVASHDMSMNPNSKGARRWVHQIWLAMCAYGIFALLSMSVLAAGIIQTPVTPTPAAVPNLPMGNGHVVTVLRLPDGSHLVGGEFSISANSATFNNLIKLTAAGALDTSWNPSPSSEVRALATDGAGHVFVAGNFIQIGGEARRYLAKLSLVNAAVDTDWNPTVVQDTNGYITSLLFGSDGYLYIAGAFSGTFGGTQRVNLAKLSATGNGAADATWNPAPDNSVWAIALDSAGDLFAGGQFSNIGGRARAGLAKLATTGSGGADAVWNPAPGDVRSLLLDGKGQLYVGGNFNGPSPNIERVAADGVGTVDANWVPHPDASSGALVFALALDNYGGLIIGGSFQTVGYPPHQSVFTGRNNLARIPIDGGGTCDPVWNPSPNGAIYTLSMEAGAVVWIGGGFSTIGGVARVGLAAMNVAENVFHDGFDG